jgi:glycosyltransferase involved in cell wall biosynthesis
MFSNEDSDVQMDKFTLVAVAKNEGMFLKEWVFYHRLICGFEEIVVYNNDSDDNSEEVLSDLSSKGMCKWLNWPRSEHNPPQSTAYHDAFRRLKGTLGWLCFMDIDEFLFLKDGSDIRTFAGRFADDVGSISFNWSMFYSVDEMTSSEPVTKSVNCFSEENGHVKTMARIGAIRVPCIHSFRLAPGYRYIHCSGFDYRIDLKELASIKMSLDASMCIKRPYIDCGTAQINHYRVKSKEYCLMKDRKGCAASSHFRSLNSLGEYEGLKNKERKHKKDIEIYINKKNGEFYNLI